jgi:hypothetical protein
VFRPRPWRRTILIEVNSGDRHVCPKDPRFGHDVVPIIESPAQVAPPKGNVVTVDSSRRFPRDGSRAGIVATRSDRLDVDEYMRSLTAQVDA